MRFREDFFVSDLKPVALRVSAGTFGRAARLSVPLLTQRAPVPLVAAFGCGSVELVNRGLRPRRRPKYLGAHSMSHHRARPFLPPAAVFARHE